MKHIGILAHSFEGATLCYRTTCLEGVRRLGPHLHPEVTMTGIAMHYMMDAYEAGDHAQDLHPWCGLGRRLAGGPGLRPGQGSPRP